MPKVGIVMGSDSDMPVMSKAADILEKLGIDYEMLFRLEAIIVLVQNTEAMIAQKIYKEHIRSYISRDKFPI